VTTRGKPGRVGPVVVLILTTTLIAGCASLSANVTPVIDKALSPSTTTTSTTPTTTPHIGPCDPKRSLRWVGPVPQPGAMPAASYMRTILQRGLLTVGVDQTTLFFGYRIPQTGEIDGFDIALAREIARAIFGNPNAIELKAVTTDQRLPVVESGLVDMVASQVTATCSRRTQVDLSTIYYLAHQKLLVRKGGSISSVADLNGKKVCATAGSTSFANIEKLAPGAVLYPVAVRADCLVALEEGWVDAITSDDTILLGFEAQDPNNTQILPAELEDEPYALATSKAHPEFGQFVNGVLDQLRASGRLEELYRQYLNRSDVGFVPPAAPPPASYQD